MTTPTMTMTTTTTTTTTTTPPSRKQDGGQGADVVCDIVQRATKRPRQSSPDQGDEGESSVGLLSARSKKGTSATVGRQGRESTTYMK
jgi:hypothetical protein